MTSSSSGNKPSVPSRNPTGEPVLSALPPQAADAAKKDGADQVSAPESDAAPTAQK